MKCRTLLVYWGIAVCAYVASLNSVHAQGTAFTYQGSLSVNGASAAGSYDLQFILRQAGNAQLGPTLTNAPVGVTNGLFNAILDFGNLFNVSPLYLEIGVRTNGSTGAYTILSPAQLLTSVPYAIQSLRATTYTGAIADAQLSTNIAKLNTNSIFSGLVTLNNATGKFGGTLSGTFNGTATGTFNGTVIGAVSGTFNGTSTGTFVGDGAAITNINVTNVAGAVPGNPDWQLVQTIPQQGFAGESYIATNTATAMLILPPSPAIGNTVRISGSGSSGWSLTQNAGQSILTSTLGLPAGQTWNAHATTQPWHAVTASAGGLKLAAAANNGTIYYSNDGGTTWTASDAPALNWAGIASSADGTHMVAVPNGDYVYTSVNGGVNWNKQTASSTTNRAYTCVASSADGYKLVAAVGGGSSIFTSTNGGSNWSARIGNPTWTAVSSSADGTKLAVTTTGLMIYSSIDSGATWTNTGPSAAWTSVAASADGIKLVASISNGSLYTSTDAGVTWRPRFGAQPWTGVASSSNGLNLAAASTSAIYTSTDGGNTWATHSPSLSWAAIASNADGSRLLAAVSSGQLYTSVASTTPGVAGFLAGSQYSNIQVQYVGNGVWMPLTAMGTFTGN